MAYAADNRCFALYLGGARYMVNYIILLFVFICLVACQEKNGLIKIAEEDNVLKNLVIQLDENDLSGYDYYFYHISDTHGSDYSLKYMSLLLDNTEALFGIITGDILMTDSMRKIIDNSSKPIFLLPGNHDIFDDYKENGQYSFRDIVINPCNWVNNVRFGNQIANYYYYDFTINQSLHRLICIDQYEINVVGKVPDHHVVVSQEQVDWLIDSLEEAGNYASILIAMHSGFGNSRIGGRDFTYKNKFVSITGGNPDSYEFYGDGDPRLIPDIIEAYKTGDNISLDYHSGKDGFLVNASTSFSKAHDNFVAYFGGHTHWDVVEFLNYHSAQLQSIISTANHSVPSKYDDLHRESTGLNAITINSCCVNANRHKLKVIRLGTRTLADGTIRDSIIFEY